MAKIKNTYNQKNHLIKVFAFIFIFWFILSGLTSPLMIFLGLLSAAFVMYIVNKMDLIDHEISMHNFDITNLTLYFFWLIKEITISNLKVCFYIINPKKDTAPEIIKIKSTQKSDLAHVLYANSITLTPGTVTLDVDNETFTVHVLDKTFKDSLLSNTMNSKVMHTEKSLENIKGK
tara:strand:+ start:3372 stop:3899 length:528 start_codon:yes stop_codon:yes gene_type:complete